MITTKLNKKQICHSIICLFFSLCVISALSTYFIIKPFYSEINIKGVDYGTNEIIYLKINKYHISYDILTDDKNKTGFLLTRFFLFDDNTPILCQTILNNEFEKITNWDIIEIDNKNNKVSIILLSISIIININGDILNIPIENNIPINFRNFKITNYKYDGNLENESILYSLNKISNPNITEIYNDPDTNPNITSVIVDFDCLIGLVNKAMTLGPSMVFTGICNQYNSIGIQGTDFKDIGDIWSDISGALYDNYKTGFKRLKNFDYKVYDICFGYSLGGGITKYMANNNYCKNVITIGSPLTFRYNNKIPIIQYINVIDDNDGCCKFNWKGECKEYGMYLVDPVTLILKGKHENVKYIGNKINNNCIGNFAYTVYKDNFNLHMLWTYHDNLKQLSTKNSD